MLPSPKVLVMDAIAESRLRSFSSDPAFGEGGEGLLFELALGGIPNLVEIVFEILPVKNVQVNASCFKMSFEALTRIFHPERLMWFQDWIGEHDFFSKLKKEPEERWSHGFLRARARLIRCLPVANHRYAKCLVKIQTNIHKDGR